jgi:hypothetical protein
LKEGTKLEAMGMKDLPKPVKMALRTKDRQSEDTAELVKRLKDLNPRFNMVHPYAGETSEPWVTNKTNYTTNGHRTKCPTFQTAQIMFNNIRKKNSQ